MPLGAHIDKAVKEAILSIPVCPCPQAGGDRQASGRDNFVSPL